MAEENVLTSERVPPPDAMSWLDAEDSEINKIPLNPEVKSADLGGVPAETPPAETPPAEPPPGDVAPPPAEEPPTETPPASGEAEPDDDLALDTETPATEVEGKAPRKHPRWRDVREAERARKEAERRFEEIQRENAHLRGVVEGRATAQPTVVQPPAEATQPADDVDPLTAVEREIATMKRENAEMRQTLQARELENTVNNQERDFAAKNPDYNQALEHYVKVRRTELEESGELDTLQQELSALPQNDPLRGQVMNMIRRGVDNGQTQGEATRDAVFAIAIGAERNRLVASAMRTGKNPSEVVYNRAKRAGWQTPSSTPAKPADEPVRTPKPSKEAIREAATSVATLARSSTPPPNGRMTKRQLMSLPTEDMEKYIDDHDRTDPGWYERMPND